MGIQTTFIELNLPNRNKIINSEDLKNRLLHPICYCFDLGGYKLVDLFNSPYEFGNVKVIVKHIGEIKYSSAENIQKLLFHYEHVKEFENAYDCLDTNKPISKVLIKNEIIVYSYQNKLLVNANVKDAKNMIKCIKECVYSKSNLNGKKKE